MESKDEKIMMLEESNQTLQARLEEAVIECEEKSKYIVELEYKAEILLEKIEKAEKNVTELEVITIAKKKKLNPPKLTMKIL